MLIEKNVAIRTRTRGKMFDIPWDKMGIGDSVVVEHASHIDGRSTIRAQATSRGIKISAAKEYDKEGVYRGLRVWVVKKYKIEKKKC